MRRPWVCVSFLLAVVWFPPVSLRAEEPSQGKTEPTPAFVSEGLVVEEPWLEPMPIPADPELEAQIQEVQEALSTIHTQMVRRKDALGKTQDPATKARLLEEFERLRQEREDLEALLHDLVDEAKISEQTAIDEALAKARWLERQREYQEQREELIRDRQE